MGNTGGIDVELVEEFLARAPTKAKTELLWERTRRAPKPPT